MSENDVFWKLTALSDEQVLDGLRHTLACGWRLSARLIAHLVDVEERRLHFDAACSSMFSSACGTPCDRGARWLALQLVRRRRQALRGTSVVGV
jgi:hypothetical protein